MKTGIVVVIGACANNSNTNDVQLFPLNVTECSAQELTVPSVSYIKQYVMPPLRFVVPEGVDPAESFAVQLNRITHDVLFVLVSDKASYKSVAFPVFPS